MEKSNRSKSVDVYENFGQVQGAQKDVLVYVKNGNTYLLDPNLEFVKDAVILDTIAGKEYQTVLATDGKLYDLKTELKYPKGFVNEGIKYISNNIDSDSKNVIVEYKDGSIVMFNYKTGELLLEDQGKKLNLEDVKVENLSIFEFVKQKFDLAIGKVKDLFNIDSSTNKVITLKDSYDDALKKEKFVEDKYISENKMDPYNSSSKLKTMYNSETGEYEVYSMDEIMSGDGKKVVSETEKVKSELGISDLNGYIAEGSSFKAGINSIILFVVIVIAIYACIYNLLIKKKAY